MYSKRENKNNQCQEDTDCKKSIREQRATSAERIGKLKKAKTRRIDTVGQENDKNYIQLLIGNQIEKIEKRKKNSPNQRVQERHPTQAHPQAQTAYHRPFTAEASAKHSFKL